MTMAETTVKPMTSALTTSGFERVDDVGGDYGPHGDPTTTTQATSMENADVDNHAKANNTNKTSDKGNNTDVNSKQ